tara:strand:+ start:529 stop:735 length:207 start_codon:yes stop_codon:yes gene_type:complete
MKVFASPNTEIMLGGAILWEISWQRKGEDMVSQLVQLPPLGWGDPILQEFLPEDVIEALITKYGLNEK